MRVDVIGCAVCAPGLPDWPHAIEVLCGRLLYERSAMRDPTPVALPSNERRRLPPTARLALGIGMEALAVANVDASVIATVFASCGSDGQITHQICESLAHVPPDVSPTRFHNSVHNAPGGYWSIALSSHAPSTSLCAFEGSFAAGLVEAAAQVSFENRPVLLIAYDLPYPPPLSSLWSMALPFCTALVLAPPAGQARDAVTLEITLLGERQESAWPAGIPFELSVNPAGTSLRVLELIAKRIPNCAVLPCQPDNAVAVTLIAS